MDKQQDSQKKSPNYKQTVLITLLIFLVVGLVYIYKKDLLHIDLFSKIVNTTSEETPEEEKGFRLIQRIPEKDGPTMDYEIRLKFSEPISVDDFEVKVDKPGFELKKVVVKGKPDTLWILPVKKWVYDLPYNLTITSKNPDKKLEKPIRIRYIFKVWEDFLPKIEGNEGAH